MGKKLLISILLLLLCACSQSNNSTYYLSTQYVDILKNRNYYMSYMDPTMTNDHTPVIMEIARKELLSAVRYDMNGSVISSIADNQTLTFIVNGKVINQAPIQEYKEALGSDSLAGF